MYGNWAALLGSVYRVKAAVMQPDIVGLLSSFEHRDLILFQVVVADNGAASHIFQNPYNYGEQNDLQGESG